MKITCLKEDLEKAVSNTERITGKNLNLPVLKGILINVNKSIVLSSTNLDLGIEIEISGKVEKEGRVVIEGGILNSLLSNIQTNKNLTLELKSNNLFITGENIKITLSTLPSNEFPLIPKPKKGKSIKIKANLFTNGLKSVWSSASNSTIKPELSSVYICPNGEQVIFVATDSFRLSEKKILFNNIVNFEPILIPVKNVVEIIRNLEDTTGDVEIIFEENQISFIYKKQFLTSRIINGAFPDYKQIIPKEFNTEIISLKEDVINSLKQSNVLSDKFNQIIFSVFPSKKTLTIKSRNEKGENISRVEASLNGDDIEIGFNYRYIIDAFQPISSDSVSFSLTGPGRPMVIKGVSDSSFIYVVMPMNK